jgi:hypothetical protein
MRGPDKSSDNNEDVADEVGLPLVSSFIDLWNATAIGKAARDSRRVFPQARQLRAREEECVGRMVSVFVFLLRYVVLLAILADKVVL